MTHARTALALAMMMAGGAIPSSTERHYDPPPKPKEPEVPEKLLTTYEMKRIEKAKLKRERKNANRVPKNPTM